MVADVFRSLAAAIQLSVHDVGLGRGYRFINSGVVFVVRRARFDAHTIIGVVVCL